MSQDLTQTTTGGFAADMSVELEQNSKGINRRIRLNLKWENWSANSVETGGDESDNTDDFMIGLGDGVGGSGKNQPARLVLARLLYEGMVAAEHAIAAGLNGEPMVLDADFTELVKAGALMPRPSALLKGS